MAETAILPCVLSTNPIFHDPEYPSTEVLDDEQKKLVDAFNAEVIAGRIPMEDVPCLCGAKDAVLVATYDRYRLRQDTRLCTQCGILRSNPRLTPSFYREFYATDLYRRLYDPEALRLDRQSFERMVAKRRYRFDFVRQHLSLEKGLCILEVGCGGGWNLWPYHQAGCIATGYDPSPHLVGFGRSLGLDLRRGFFEDVELGVFDLVILSHIVEHLPNPVLTVESLARRVGPEALFYIEVPNADHFALGGLQNAHTFWFTPRTLKHYLARAGLVLVATQNFGSHVGALFRRGVGQAESLGREFNCMAGLIRRYERRERVKSLLARWGILEIARQFASRLRG